MGVSLVDVPRFRRCLERFGPRVRARVFTDGEVAYADAKRRGEQSFAGRFAAKCAARQVLVRCLGAPVALRDLEVVRRPSGEPTLELRGAARRAAGGRAQMHLSLTHDADFAMASVLVTSASGVARQGAAEAAPRSEAKPSGVAR